MFTYADTHEFRYEVKKFFNCTHTLAKLPKWASITTKLQILPGNNLKQHCFNHLVVNLGWETESIMYFPRSYGVICRAHYEYTERTFSKQRQQEIKSSSITVMNILPNCWWRLFHRIAMPSLLPCDGSEDTAGSHPSLEVQKQEQNLPVQTKNCCEAMMALQEEAAFSPRRHKTNALPTHSPMIEMTHCCIFLLHMTLTITAHYPWPVLNAGPKVRDE